jgi:DNA-directed RNA polymerase subunit F
VIIFHKKILDEERLTLAQVKEILLKRAQNDVEELSYLQKMTFNYVNEFCQLSLEDSLKFRNELIEKFEIPIEIATQIVDLRDLPSIIEELDIFFTKSSIRLSDEQKQQLLELILSYKEKNTEDE